MAYRTTSRNGKRFLGNTHKKEVHDMLKEDKRPNGCQVDEFLRAGHGVYFILDNHDQAKKEG